MLRDARTWPRPPGSGGEEPGSKPSGPEEARPSQLFLGNRPLGRGQGMSRRSGDQGLGGRPWGTDFMERGSKQVSSLQGGRAASVLPPAVALVGPVCGPPS